MRKRDTCRLSLQVTKGSVATGVQVLERVRSYEWVARYGAVAQLQRVWQLGGPSGRTEAHESRDGKREGG